MEFDTLIRKRRMVRNFTSQPVEQEKIEQILDLARRAPSAGFTQGQSFIVIQDLEIRQKVADICGEAGYVQAGFDPFITRAPVLIIPCTSEAAYHQRYQEPDKVNEDGNEIDWPVPYWFMDIGCSMMVILLAAIDLGLAAGFAGAFDLDALRNLLSIPAEVTPVGVIPIGYPAPDQRSPSLKRGRREITQVIHRGRW